VTLIEFCGSLKWLRCYGLLGWRLLKVFLMMRCYLRMKLMAIGYNWLGPYNLYFDISRFSSLQGTACHIYLPSSFVLHFTRHSTFLLAIIQYCRALAYPPMTLFPHEFQSIILNWLLMASLRSQISDRVLKLLEWRFWTLFRSNFSTCYQSYC
jgi:hypothetical protein